MGLSLDNIVLAYSIPIFALLIIVEFALSAYQKKDLYYLKDTASSLAMGFGSLFFGATMKFLALLFYTF
ncbi:MAG: hypothetical protein KDC82_08945, partial [Bacteroidetes bacterium]|nr:hypothetical protein [Bacteroidota bacterium]